MRHLRLLAGFLAAGGIAWGAFCTLVILAVPGSAILFLPGYLVTAGYLAISCAKANSGWRRFIWMFSAFLQGAWLLWAMSGVVQGAWFIDGRAFPILSLGWWVFAFLASVYAFVAEPEGRAA